VRTLLVGAMDVETRPLLAALGRTRRTAPYTRVGTLHGQDVAVLTCGVGPHKAHMRTRAALAIFPADRVVSVGTAGALVDGLARGGVHAATALLSGGEHRADLLPLGDLPGATVASVARAVWDPERRALLAAAGAQLVEMELAAVYDATREMVPAATVHAIKVVSDAAGAGRTGPRSGPGKLLAIARFQARAHALCRDHLAPAVVDALR
jgi:nucleoside phosphorylase